MTRRERLETLFLIKLMRRDAKVWRTRMYTAGNAQLAEPLDHETAMDIGHRMKRVHLRGFQKPPP
jgi:hypothetical protein